MVELHQKLGILYPHVKLPSLTGHKAVGRTHIKQVAEKRKAELEGYLTNLLQLKDVSVVSLAVYSFTSTGFKHALLVDESISVICSDLL